MLWRILCGKLASIGLIIMLSTFLPACKLTSEMAIAKAADTVRNIERKWEAAELRSDDTQTAQQLAEAFKAVTEHLMENGDDVEVLILGAKLEFFALDAEPAPIAPIYYVAPGNPSLEEQFRARTMALQRAHEWLDRAIDLRPGDPEPHFWKSRIYMLKALVTRNRVSSVEENMEDALREMQIALRLDPVNELYAVQVIWMLMQYQQDVLEAARVARELRKGNHPRSELLSSWVSELASIPLPEDAIPWPVGLESVSQFLAVPQLPLRTVLRLVPDSIEHVEAFYATHWPDFTLHEMEPGDTKIRGQWLHWRDGLIELATPEQFRTMEGYPSHGIFIMVSEFDQPPEDEIARRDFPIPVDRVYCTLLIINMRTVPDP